MVSKKTNIKIDDFLSSVEKMIDSKYILADQRISDVLRAIAENKYIYNVIAECMINFDFAKEWKEATKTSYLKLPQQEAKKISFIFCMLSNIDDKKIELTKILEDYFSYNATISPYELFCSNIISEFVKLLVKQLGIWNEVFPNLESNDQLQNDEFVVLYKLVNDFNNTIIELKKYKHIFIKKEDLIAINSTFLQIIQNRQVGYFYSYKVTILSAIRKNKELVRIFEPIDKIIENIIKE